MWSLARHDCLTRPLEPESLGHRVRRIACAWLRRDWTPELGVRPHVDDAQWLDAPSAEALVFMARRVNAEGTVVLLALRDGERGRFGPPRLDERVLGGPDHRSSRTLLDRRSRAFTQRIERLPRPAQAALLPAATDEAGELARDQLRRRHLPASRSPERAPQTVMRWRCGGARRSPLRRRSATARSASPQRPGRARR